MTKDDGDPFEKMFGKADPPPGKKYDFAYAEVSNPRPGVVVIGWSARGMGFGEVTLLMRDNGKLYLDTECMSDRFLNELFEFLVLQSTKDPEEIPADCWASNHNEVDLPRDEEICVAYVTVDQLVKHHGLADGEYLEDLKKRADDAHKRWFHKQYTKAGT